LPGPPCLAAVQEPPVKKTPYLSRKVRTVGKDEHLRCAHRLDTVEEVVGKPVVRTASDDSLQNMLEQGICCRNENCVEIS